MCEINTVHARKGVSTPRNPGEASNTLGTFPTPPRAWERAMLGPAKLRRLSEPIAVSLEDLVPKDHFYRHLEATLDLDFVRGYVQELCADRGRPSIDPVVFFKLQLIMFFEGIRSERKLIETASLNLAHRWYLGYALDEELPDHSSLTRIRQQLGIDLFHRFFETIVDLC
jgi:transposase